MQRRCGVSGILLNTGVWMAGLIWAALAVADEFRVEDFALLDHTGKFHQLSYYSNQKAVVLLSQANEAAGARENERRFADLADQFAAEPVRLFMLNAMPGDSRESVAATVSQNVSTPVLLDVAQLVASALDIRRVNEVLVIDPATMTLMHRGLFDDTGAAAVAGVVNALLQGRAQPGTTAPLAAGPAAIPFPSRAVFAANPVSYTKDIVPILERNCVGCHQEGGIGPWAMNSHLMVRGFGPMIKEVVTTRRMPPGQIDNHVSRAVKNVAGLSIAEQQKLIHWIDAGAPLDGEEDPLAALEITPQKFTMGEPDLVYTIPAQQIPASGLVDYRYIPLKLDLDRDVWIRGMEFVPGDRQVLHHVIAYVQAPADRSLEGRRDVVARGESIGGFAPGRAGEDFGEDGGRLLQKGANLLLQMHYTTSGRETVDETQIGIYLHDAPPKHVMSEVVAAQRRFLVPPYAQEHVLEGEKLIERDAYLHAMMPHMHYRGKYMSYTAVYPDGREELLLSVPKYDFNWQFNYELEEPVFLPAGTRLLVRGAMDNSAQNKGNPDPSQPVHFGLQTQHEMFFGFMTMRYPDVKPQDTSNTAR